MRRLPPLSAIEAFVQVARLGSLKAAAEELALSSPALTRRIQALERFVGHALFERRHQAVTLNPTASGCCRKWRGRSMRWRWRWSGAAPAPR
jgi:DNA-binding transcriptional LysR family regulator